MKLIILPLLLLVSCRGEFYLNTNTKFPDLNKKESFSIKSAKAEILILNFFAPDCPPCIEEMPDLKKYTKDLPKHISFIGIGSVLEAIGESLANTDSKLIDRVKMFKQEHNITYPVYLAGSEQLNSFKVTGFPETLVFKLKDNSYQLKRRHLSAITYKELVSFTNNLEEPW